MPRACSLLLGGACLLAPALVAQQGDVSLRRLTAPERVHPEEFSLLRSIRELSDGRLLVVDWIEDRVVLLDWDQRTATTIGRQGGGPAEYRLPSRLIPLPGDTTLLVDLGNARLSLIGPGLTFTGVVSRPDDVQYPLTPRVADSRGRLYFEIPGWATGAQPAESVSVMRWDRGTGRIEQVGRVRGYTPKPPGRSMNIGIPFVMFAPEDGWTAAPDGRSVFVRSADYVLETHGPGGAVSRGPSQAYVTAPVTLQDKRAFVRWFLATSPMSGRGPDGGMGHGPASMETPEAVDQITRNNLFAERRPYFSPGGVWATGKGEAWVLRSSVVDSVPVLDHFDRSGRIVERVTLPANRRVLGFGRGVLYAAATGPDGIQRVERYRI